MRKYIMLLAALFLMQPALSYADHGDHGDHHEGRHYYHYYDHPHFGLHVSFIPDEYITVGVGGSRYYYYDGLYYSQMGGEYVLINPPIGAVVTTVPPDYRPVTINGVTYYMDNGVYYVYTRYGYQVVPSPVTVVQAPPQTVVTPVPAQAVPQIVPAAAQPQAAQPQAAERETAVVNVPNSDGSFMPITLLKSNNGYIGPQGEYYEGHPTVKQLKTLYGK